MTSIKKGFFIYDHICEDSGINGRGFHLWARSRNKIYTEENNKRNLILQQGVCVQNKMSTYECKQNTQVLKCTQVQVLLARSVP